MGFFMKLRFPRGLASFVACSLSLMTLYFVGLGLYTEGVSMMDDLPAYIPRRHSPFNSPTTEAAQSVATLRGSGEEPAAGRKNEHAPPTWEKPSDGRSAAAVGVRSTGSLSRCLHRLPGNGLQPLGLAVGQAANLSRQSCGTFTEDGGIKNAGR